MHTTASETITFKSLAEMDHSGEKKSLELASHIISLEYNCTMHFRSIHTVLQPTFFMVTSEPYLTQNLIFQQISVQLYNANKGMKSKLTGR